jgi:hypothetical protein
VVSGATAARPARALTEVEKAFGEAIAAREKLDKARDMDKLAGSDVSKAAVAKAEEDHKTAIRKYGKKLLARIRAHKARIASEDSQKRKAADDALKQYFDARDEWLKTWARLLERMRRWWTTPEVEEHRPPGR